MVNGNGKNGSRNGSGSNGSQKTNQQMKVGENSDKKSALTSLSNFHEKQPKPGNQQSYVENIQKYDISFGIGPAGTGKTWLATMIAISELKKGNIKKIIITRPVREAGESLGFLPGDLQEKIDPYLRPIFDAIDEFIGKEAREFFILDGTIEIAPLAYMRGRTLKDAFIILDEAQNTTKAQMKMFLTRFGEGSKMVINGDITQVDLPYDVPSGLKIAKDKLSGKGDKIPFTFFKTSDVLRHPIVKVIVKLWDETD